MTDIPAVPTAASVSPAISGAVFDRTLTLGLIVTILLETAGALHWAGAHSSRVAALERQAAINQPIGTRLTRLEEQVSGIRRTLERIERDLGAVESTVAAPWEDAHD